MRCLTDERCDFRRRLLVVILLLGYLRARCTGPQLSYRCPWRRNQPSKRYKDQDHVLVVRHTGEVPVSAITDDSGIGLLGGRKTPYCKKRGVWIHDRTVRS